MKKSFSDNLRGKVMGNIEQKRDFIIEEKTEDQNSSKIIASPAEVIKEYKIESSKDVSVATDKKDGKSLEVTERMQIHE